jgi:hypothetical protein
VQTGSNYTGKNKTHYNSHSYSRTVEYITKSISIPSATICHENWHVIYSLLPQYLIMYPNQYLIQQQNFTSTNLANCSYPTRHVYRTHASTLHKVMLLMVISFKVVTDLWNNLRLRPTLSCRDNIQFQTTLVQPR